MPRPFTSDPVKKTYAEAVVIPSTPIPPPPDDYSNKRVVIGLSTEAKNAIMRRLINESDDDYPILGDLYFY